MATTTGAIECQQVRVRGRVQGVGYRDACVHEARRLGVTGWVRNRRDDSVEALLQGDAPRLAAMRAWMQDGVPAARVVAMEVSAVPAPFERHDCFERRPTL